MSYDKQKYKDDIKQLFNFKDIRGKFIYIEGPDGVGKTTQIKNLNMYFKELGYKVICIRHPGYNAYSRDMLFSEGHVRDFWSKRLIFLAEYLDILADIQNDNFDSDTIYLVDRSVLVSNICIGGAEYDMINYTDHGAVEVAKKLLPFYDKKERLDCVIILYNDPAMSESRLKERTAKGGESNLYDEMGINFRSKCAKNYLNLVLVSQNTQEILPFYGIYGNPIIGVDATDSECKVFSEIVKKLNEKFTIKDINK